MASDTTPKALVLQVGTIVVSLGLFLAPWVFHFADSPAAAWSAWTLSALILVVGAVNSVGGAPWTPLLLLTLGLWAVIAPAILSFGLHNRAAFWTHIVVGLLAMAGGYMSFRDVDGGNMLTS